MIGRGEVFAGLGCGGVGYGDGLGLCDTSICRSDDYLSTPTLSNLFFSIFHG